MKAVSNQRSAVSKGVICLAVCAMLLGLCVSAEAQQQTKVNKIGWLTGSSLLRLDGYKKALQALGYIEGKNTAFEYRVAGDEPGRFPLWLPS